MQTFENGCQSASFLKIIMLPSQKLSVSVYSDLCRYIVFLYIANFWPGMNNTIVLIVLWICVNGDRLTILSSVL